MLLINAIIFVVLESPTSLSLW